MGKTTVQTSGSEKDSTTPLSDWSYIHTDETKPSNVQDVSSLDGQSPTRHSNTQNTFENGEWQLPLESLVLDNRDIPIPLNFLRIYPAILRKFGCSPVDALGKIITYFQAVFMESPGFHPYITHLPWGSLPTNDSEGRQIAEALERELIRILQRLLASFCSDVNAIVRYIDTCPEQLIPRPQFVISKTENPTSYRANTGVQGFNNGNDGGQLLWQNPASQSLGRQKENDALQRNIRKCCQMIQMAGIPSIGGPGPEQFGQQPRFVHNPLPPPRPQIPIYCTPTPTVPPPVLVPVPPFTPPMQSQFQPQHFAMQTPFPQVSPPKAPQLFHTPPTHQPMQVPVALPQLNAGPLNLPARVTPQPILAAAKPQDNMVSMQNKALKDDLDRIEAQMTRLLDLISRDQPNGA